MDNDFQPEADETPEEERSPEFIPSRPGRLVSVYGLVERIVEEFFLEHGDEGSESKAALDAQTVTEKRRLVRDVADYIFSVESVQLSLSEQARLIARAYGEIFSYGPLDELLTNEQIVTLVIEGTEKLAVRYAPGADLVPLEPIFEDVHHLRATLKRLLRDAHAELRDDVAILETGMVYEGRRMAVNVVAPPYVPEITVDIRLHPKVLPSLDDLVSSAYMPAKAAQVLEALVKSEHGFMIVGDTESGKTSLLAILAQLLPNPASIMAVERSGELALPEGAQRLVTSWTIANQTGHSFGERILEALETGAETLLLDEVRADEPETIAPLLTNEQIPRQIWSFRGSSTTKRIASSLGILARMTHAAQPEAMVYALQKRLPFLILIKRSQGRLQLRGISEWQFPNELDPRQGLVYAEITPLMEIEESVCELTGKRPQNALHLPDDFWVKA